MIDLNTGLIALLGAAHGANLFWFRSWKGTVDKSLHDLHDKVDDAATRTARIEGYLNGKDNASK
jgi:hypothetical protein